MCTETAYEFTIQNDPAQRARDVQKMCTETAHGNSVNSYSFEWPCTTCRGRAQDVHGNGLRIHNSERRRTTCRGRAEDMHRSGSREFRERLFIRMPTRNLHATYTRTRQIHATLGRPTNCRSGPFTPPSKRRMQPTHPQRHAIKCHTTNTTANPQLR